MSVEKATLVRREGNPLHICTVGFSKILLHLVSVPASRAVYRAEDQPVSIPPGFDRLIAGYRTGRL